MKNRKQKDYDNPIEEVRTNIHKVGSQNKIAELKQAYFKQFSYAKLHMQKTTNSPPQKEGIGAKTKNMSQKTITHAIPARVSKEKKADSLEKETSNDHLSYQPIKERLFSKPNLFEKSQSKTNMDKESLNLSNSLNKNSKLSSSGKMHDKEYVLSDDDHKSLFPKTKLPTSVAQTAISTLTKPDEIKTKPLIIENQSFSYENSKSLLLYEIDKIKKAGSSHGNTVFKTEEEKEIERINFEFLKREISFDELSQINKLFVNFLHEKIEGRINKQASIPIDIIMSANDGVLKGYFSLEEEKIRDKQRKELETLKEERDLIKNGIDMMNTKILAAVDNKNLIKSKIEKIHTESETFEKRSNTFENQNTILKLELVNQKKSFAILKKEAKTELNELKSALKELKNVVEQY